MARKTMLDSTKKEKEKEKEKQLGLRRQDVIFVIGIVAFALAIGSLGYYYTTQFDLLDSFYNASLILSGMGPAEAVESVAGKFFASFYAIFSGFVIIVIITIFIQRLVIEELE